MAENSSPDGMSAAAHAYQLATSESAQEISIPQLSAPAPPPQHTSSDPGATPAPISAIPTIPIQQDTPMQDMASSEPLLTATSTPQRTGTPNPQQNSTSRSHSRAPSLHPEQANPTEAPVHGAPARQYLNSNVTPALKEGLKYLAVHRPAEPLRWLGEYLIQMAKETEQEGEKKDGGN